MSRIKKIILLLVIAVVPLLLSGCLELKMHLTINPNRSADLEITLSAPELLLLLKPENKAELEEFLEEKKAELAAEGFTISELERDDTAGFKAVKRLPSVEHLADLGLARDIGLKDQQIFTVKKSALTTTYHLDADLDLKDLIGEQNETLALLSKMRFILTLPVKPLDHNATTVSEDERTLEWALSPAESNNLQLTARAPNLAAVIIGIVIAVMVPGSIIILVVYRPVLKQERSAKRMPGRKNF